MGMGVFFAGPAVGGPARVSKSDVPGQRRRLEQGFQIAQLSRSPASFDPPLRDHRDPRGIVAPILEPSQPLDQYGDGILRTHVTDNPTHVVLSLVPCGPRLF